MCKVIEDFKISLVLDGKSSKTIESYVGDIKVFKKFLLEHITKVLLKWKIILFQN